jgi:protein-S-isoprenylcysteine O-methyltransferase Ste14
MTGRAHFLEHRIPPPVVAVLVAVAMWVVSGLGPQWAMPVVARDVIAALFALAGVGVDLAALATFRGSRTTFNPLQPARASSLVTHGLYRVSRNPMYVGSVLLLLGWAVELSALLPFAGIVVFVLYITRFQIRPEERALAALFGDEYANYAARVRRWL